MTSEASPTGEYRLRILHVSDLHARGERDGKLAWKRGEVLGDPWRRNLDEIAADGQPFDLIAFTGDVADWGLPEEYAAATPFFEELLTRLKLPKERLFIVPGNHDVHRKTEPDIWAKFRKGIWQFPQKVSEWMADAGEVPFGFECNERDRVLNRQKAFWNWVNGELGRSELLPANSRHRRLGYGVPVRLPSLPFPVHIIGLNSAWLAGDNTDAGNLWLTEDQIGILCRDAQSKQLVGFRLALVHHPLSDLADHAVAQRLLADSVDLVLRGHQHAPIAAVHSEPGRALRELAAGCLYEGHHSNRYPNGIQVIDVASAADGRPLRYDVRFRTYSPNGHWYDDSALYRDAKNGRLIWPSQALATGSDVAIDLVRETSPAGRQPPPDSIVQESEPLLRQTEISPQVTAVTMTSPIRKVHFLIGEGSLDCAEVPAAVACVVVNEDEYSSLQRGIERLVDDIRHDRLVDNADKERLRNRGFNIVEDPRPITERLLSFMSTASLRVFVVLGLRRDGESTSELRRRLLSQLLAIRFKKKAQVVTQVHIQPGRERDLTAAISDAFSKTPPGRDQPTIKPDDASPGCPLQLADAAAAIVTAQIAGQPLGNELGRIRIKIVHIWNGDTKKHYRVDDDFP